jgi:signal transduction histidine kinase
LDVPLQLPDWTLTAEIRHNLFLAFKESLHNIVKHAHATEVHVTLHLLGDGFSLLIADNGRGFAPATAQPPQPVPSDGTRLAAGNGLLNMRKRLEEIGGRCDWITAVGEGTRVKFSILLARNGNSEAQKRDVSPPVIKTDDNPLSSFEL